MRVAAHDDVGSGGGEPVRQAQLPGVGAAHALGAPVQVDHDHVGARLRPSYGGQQGPVIPGTGRGQPSGPRAGLPDAARPLPVGRVGGEERQAGPPHGQRVRRHRARPVATDPDHGDGAAPGGPQGVGQPLLPVVRAVVVRHRDHVDARRPEQREGPRGGAVVEPASGPLQLLGVRGPLRRGDRRLEVHHRHVRAGQRASSRSESAPGAVEQSGQLHREVDVAGEGQGHGALRGRPGVASARGRPAPGHGRDSRGARDVRHG